LNYELQLFEFKKDFPPPPCNACPLIAVDPSHSTMFRGRGQLLGTTRRRRREKNKDLMNGKK
jgi:hypothetical protein